MRYILLALLVVFLSTCSTGVTPIDRAALYGDQKDKTVLLLKVETTAPEGFSCLPYLERDVGGSANIQFPVQGEVVLLEAESGVYRFNQVVCRNDRNYRVVINKFKLQPGEVKSGELNFFGYYHFDLKGSQSSGWSATFNHAGKRETKFLSDYFAEFRGKNKKVWHVIRKEFLKVP